MSDALDILFRETEPSPAEVRSALAGPKPAVFEQLDALTKAQRGSRLQDLPVWLRRRCDRLEKSPTDGYLLASARLAALLELYRRMASDAKKPLVDEDVVWPALATEFWVDADQLRNAAEHALNERLAPPHDCSTPKAIAKTPIVVVPDGFKIGSVYWLAVEVWDGAPSFLPDLWSLGMTAFPHGAEHFPTSLSNVWKALGGERQQKAYRWRLERCYGEPAIELSGRSAEAACACAILEARALADATEHERAAFGLSEIALVSATVEESSEGLRLGSVKESSIQAKIMTCLLAGLSLVRFAKGQGGWTTREKLDIAVCATLGEVHDSLRLVSDSLSQYRKWVLDPKRNMNGALVEGSFAHDFELITKE